MRTKRITCSDLAALSVETSNEVAGSCTGVTPSDLCPCRRFLRSSRDEASGVTYVAICKM